MSNYIIEHMTHGSREESDDHQYAFIEKQSKDIYKSIKGMSRMERQYYKRILIAKTETLLQELKSL